jgi:hypothetical protein
MPFALRRDDAAWLSFLLWIHALPFNSSFRSLQFIVNAIKTRQLSPPGFYANGALY